MENYKKYFKKFIVTNKKYIILGTILFYLHYLYWGSNIHTNEKLKSLINIWVSTSIFISFYSIYLQTNAYHESQNQLETNSFNSLFSNFYDNI